MGALDVLPFVPLGSTPMERCIELAHHVGRRLAAELNLPVYFYAEAALQPERRLLANVRRGEYEGLRARVGMERDAAPDAGPAILGTAGATAVGARRVLVAFNVRLGTRDVRAAREIARRVRASNGGLPGVQALGLELATENMVQVSMNVTDLARTPLHVAYEAVCAAAAELGVAVAESELVGLLPAEAALLAASARLGLPALTSRQVIDLAIHQDAPNGDR
jgi:glutamate formiminotransferase